MDDSINKHLIIPCHSAGMGSILNGAVAGLLYAEITGRTPLIYWNAYCKYMPTAYETHHNAYTDFFQETSTHSIEYLLTRSQKVFPSKTTILNIDKVIQAYQGKFADLCSTHTDDFDVLLFPLYVSIEAVAQLLPEEHALHGADTSSITRWIAELYIEIRPEIKQQVDIFWNEHFKNESHVVTLHIREGDKYREAVLPNYNKYKATADAYLKKHPNAKIFLASDSDTAINYFQQRYGPRLITSTATRSSGRKGVHRMRNDGTKIGNEIVFDAECLSRGTHFIGLDESNVFQWVCHITKRGREHRFTAESVQHGISDLIFNRRNLKKCIQDTLKEKIR
ncbi:MAG TPA: hypothetical protein DCX06_00380 [Opitutae bacterium]|nr:hypothetical protein [Opitutae bacterium]